MNKLLSDAAADRARKSIIGLAISLACSSMTPGQSSLPVEADIKPASTLPVLTAIAIQPPGPEPITDVRVSPDGQRLVYVQRTNQLCRVVLHEGPAVDCDEISTWGFTRDSVCYAVVRRGFAWHLVVDGKLGAASDSIDINSWQPSADTHPAFKAKRGHIQGWVAFGIGTESFLQGAGLQDGLQIRQEQLSLDGRQLWQWTIDSKGETRVFRNGAPVADIQRPLEVSFAPIGENFAYTHQLNTPDGGAVTEFVAGGLRKQFLYAGSITWSQNGEHSIFSASRRAENEDGSEAVIVFDGQEYPALRDGDKWSPILPGDGARFAALVSRKEGRGILCESQFIPIGDAYAESIQFSPDGKHLTYSLRNKEMRYFVFDQQQHGPYGQVRSVCFSPDNQHWACAAVLNGVWTVVVDGQPQCPVGEIRHLEFSKDSKHVYYVATPSKSSNQQTLYRDANVVFPLVYSDASHPFGPCDELIEVSSSGLAFGGARSVSPRGIVPVVPQVLQGARKRSPQGQPVLFGKSSNAPLQLFRLNLERVPAPRKLAGGKVIENNQGVQAATISEDGSSVFAVVGSNNGSRELVVMAAASGNIISRFPLAQAEHFQLISAGANVAVGQQEGMGRLRVDAWDTAQVGAPPQTVVSDLLWPRLVAVNPRKQSIAVAGFTGPAPYVPLVRVHELGASKRTGTIRGANLAVFDPSSDSLLAVDSPTNPAQPVSAKLMLYDMERGACSKICALPTNSSVQAALFEPAGGIVRLWVTVNRQAFWVRLDVRQEKVLETRLANSRGEPRDWVWYSTDSLIARCQGNGMNLESCIQGSFQYGIECAAGRALSADGRLVFVVQQGGVGELWDVTGVRDYVGRLIATQNTAEPLKCEFKPAEEKSGKLWASSKGDSPDTARGEAAKPGKLDPAALAALAGTFMQPQGGEGNGNSSEEMARLFEQQKKLMEEQSKVYLKIMVKQLRETIAAQKKQRDAENDEARRKLLEQTIAYSEAMLQMYENAAKAGDDRKSGADHP